MTSTLLDATLCLLLVSSGIVSLAAVDVGETERRGHADAVAETLATSTASVNYTPRTRSGRANSRPGGEGERPAPRTAHATLATLLARAAVADAATDGRRRSEFARAVRRTVADAVGSGSTRIVAVWRPFPGSDLRGRLAVGPEPPVDADVRAATLRIDSGAEGRAAAADASDEGFGAVAAVLAARSVRLLFPVEATRSAVLAGGPLSALTRRRYQAVASQYGVRVSLSLSRPGVRAANHRLERAMRAGFERELRRTHETPEAAAEAVCIGRVDVVVRTWR